VHLEKVEAFERDNVNFSAFKGFMGYQIVDYHKLEVRVELGETEVCFIHNLGFQGVFLGDFENFRHYAKCVSSLRASAWYLPSLLPSL